MHSQLRRQRNIRVHSVAGRWEVRIAVYGIPVNDEAKDAVLVLQILEDLSSSTKTK